MNVAYVVCTFFYVPYVYRSSRRMFVIEGVGCCWSLGSRWICNRWNCNFSSKMKNSHSGLAGNRLV